MSNSLTPYYTNQVANSGTDYRVYMERQTRDILVGNAAIAGKLAGEIDDSMVRMQTGIQTAISSQTSVIVASNKALAQTYQQGFNELGNTIDMGFSGISNKLGYMSASFSFGLDRISDTLKGMSKDICDKLDAIHDIVNNPLLTQSRELFRRAIVSYNKGFFEEALEDVQAAVEKYKTDYISWFLMGKIYAFGAGEFSNVINLEKAINAFNQAAKYNSPNITESTDARLLSAEIYFYLGVAQYSQSNELSRNKKKTEAVEMLDKALKSFERSFQYSDKMFESLSNVARCKVLLGQKEDALYDLEKLVLLDRNYCIKIFSDADFSDVLEEFTALINRLKHEFFTDAEVDYKKIFDLMNDLEALGGNYENRNRIPTQFTESLPYFDIIGYSVEFKNMITQIKREIQQTKEQNKRIEEAKRKQQEQKQREEEELIRKQKELQKEREQELRVKQESLEHEKRLAAKELIKKKKKRFLIVFGIVLGVIVGVIPFFEFLIAERNEFSALSSAVMGGGFVSIFSFAGMIMALIIPRCIGATDRLTLFQCVVGLGISILLGVGFSATHTFNDLRKFPESLTDMSIISTFTIITFTVFGAMLGVLAGRKVRLR